MSPNQVITGTFQDVRRKNLLGQKVKSLPPPKVDSIKPEEHKRKIGGWENQVTYQY